ncbi:hypothetical protein [Polaribacter sp. BM10]|uniref:hypothetical protein n=1 Tax=Polaribacter sp. BM10 TaxID=1529069 RepID=UPI0016575473|nr:hypothetical protein [Polaribacter sp. BM10]
MQKLSNVDENSVAKIEKEILKLLKGQTFGDAKEIINDVLNSLEHNSIVQKDIL